MSGSRDERPRLPGQAAELAAAGSSSHLHVVLAEPEAGELDVARRCASPQPSTAKWASTRTRPATRSGWARRGLDGDGAAVAVAEQVDRPVDAERVEQADQVGDGVRRACSRSAGARCGRGPRRSYRRRRMPACEHGGERVVEARQVVDDQAVEHHHRRRRRGSRGAGSGPGGRRPRPQAPPSTPWSAPSPSRHRPGRRR